MRAKNTVILVEDEPSVRSAVGRFLGGRGYRVLEAATLAAAVETFRAERPDAVLLDYSLPDGDGLELLQALRAIDSTVPAIVLTAHGSIDLAVRAVKEGAEQFFTKPVELAAVEIALARAIESARNRQMRIVTRSRESRVAPDPFVGDSPAIRRLADQAARLAATASTVLLQGETGTGKGVLAGWLHRHGPRADEGYVELNCAGLGRELLESELFGYERGAFTGAAQSKAGLLEVAHRGTLFLDEIGDLPPEVQPKLLKVLEEQRVRRLGALRERQVDLRLISATHHDLGRMAETRIFRSDLFYRISTFPLVLPPLRERGRDVVVLARIILARVAQDLGRPGLVLSLEAEECLCRHSWPGNVRELRNVLERAALFADHHLLRPGDLFPTRIPEVGAARPRTLDEAEAAHISAVLDEVHGNVAVAAGVLGLSRSALYERMRKHGLGRRAQRTDRALAADVTQTS